MASTKDFYARVQNKHDIEANWNKVTNFVPLVGEIIIYDEDDTHDYTRMKIGDGVTNINNLDFYNKPLLYAGDEEVSSAETINADTLGGYSPSYYKDAITLNGNSESQLNVAYAANAGLLGGKEESQLSVANAGLLKNKEESQLNVAYAANAGLLGSKEESQLNVAQAENSNKLGNLTTAELIKKIYPVGSTYITSTNSSPASYLGGTWTLVDKEFSNLYGTKNEWFTVNATNTTLSGFYVVRSGHTARIKLSFKNKVSIGDTAIEIGTIAIKSMGFNTLLASQQVAGINDGGNIIFMADIVYNTGVVSTVDVVGADSVAANSGTWILDITLQGHSAIMLDAACDKFYWKRTA